MYKRNSSVSVYGAANQTLVLTFQKLTTPCRLPGVYELHDPQPLNYGRHVFGETCIIATTTWPASFYALSIYALYALYHIPTK